MQGKGGFGAELRIGQEDGPPETFTAIPGVRNISGPSPDNDIHDVSHHGSASRAKQKAAGMIDYGQVTFDLVLDTSETQQALLFTKNAAGTAVNFQKVSAETGAQQAAFSAIVKTIEESDPIDGAVIASVTLEVDGPATYT
jgi:hypothetical protein